MTWERRFALPFVVIALTGAAPVSVAAQRTFDGAYIASGVDADGNEYRRAVDIERHGDRFIVVWVSARVVGQALVLEPTWVGVGLATADTLSVSFIAENVLGIMVYRFAPDGRQLSGQWTVEGDDEVIHSETLTPLADVLPTPAEVDPLEDRQSRQLPPPAIGAVSF